MDAFPCFPGNLFAVFIYYFEMGDVGFGMIVGHTVLVNCTGDVTAVFFDLFSKHWLESPLDERLQFSSGQDHL